MRELLFDSSFTAIDLETTGFDVNHSEVIEIAAVKVEGGVITETFSSLVNPGFFISQKIRELTGITNTMLVGKPPIHDILPDFLKFVNGDVIVAHNVEQDIRFLKKYLKGRFKVPALCTLKLSRKLVPGLVSYTLDSLADHFSISRERKHRALDDALTTAYLFLELLNLLWNNYGIGDYLSIKRLAKV